MAARAPCTNLQVTALACQVRRVKQSVLKFQQGRNAIVYFFSFLFGYFYLVRKCKMHERSPEGKLSIEESLKGLFK